MDNAMSACEQAPEEYRETVVLSDRNPGSTILHLLSGAQPMIPPVNTCPDVSSALRVSQSALPCFLPHKRAQLGLMDNRPS